MQFLHSHEQEQCYYILEGKGLMIIDEEFCEVNKNDAVYIPSDAPHGIKNIGDEMLVYLTANKAFGSAREAEVWPFAI